MHLAVERVRHVVFAGGGRTAANRLVQLRKIRLEVLVQVIAGLLRLPVCILCQRVALRNAKVCPAAQRGG